MAGPVFMPAVQAPLVAETANQHILHPEVVQQHAQARSTEELHRSSKEIPKSEKGDGANKVGPDGRRQGQGGSPRDRGKSKLEAQAEPVEKKLGASSDPFVGKLVDRAV